MTKVVFRKAESIGELILVLVAGGLCWVCSCSATTEQIGQTGFDKMPVQESIKNVRIRTKFDPKAAFPQSGSFAFRKAQIFPNDPRVEVSALGTRVRQAIRRTMRKKGYEYQELRPGLLIGFKISLNGIRGTSVRREAIDGPEWRGELNDANTYEAGSLVLDILEWRSNRLLWRGVCEAKILVGVSDTEKDRRINDAVRRLLAQFPPKSGASKP